MEFKIIIKKINNSLSNEEEIIFQQWINESDKHRQYFEQVKGNYYNEIGPVNAKKSWRVLNRKINKRNIRPIQTSKIVFWKIAAVAASITILIGISYLFINDTPPAKNHITCFHQHNHIIVPGSHKAILTLNNDYQDYKTYYFTLNIGLQKQTYTNGCSIKQNSYFC